MIWVSIPVQSEPAILTDLTLICVMGLDGEPDSDSEDSSQILIESNQ